ILSTPVCRSCCTLEPESVPPLPPLEPPPLEPPPLELPPRPVEPAPEPPSPLPPDEPEPSPPVPDVVSPQAEHASASASHPIHLPRMRSKVREWTMVSSSAPPRTAVELRRQLLSHADVFFDDVAERSVKGDDRLVRGSDLEIELGATKPRE